MTTAASHTWSTVPAWLGLCINNSHCPLMVASVGHVLHIGESCISTIPSHVLSELRCALCAVTGSSAESNDVKTVLSLDKRVWGWGGVDCCCREHNQSAESWAAPSSCGHRQVTSVPSPKSSVGLRPIWLLLFPLTGLVSVLFLGRLSVLVAQTVN